LRDGLAPCRDPPGVVDVRVLGAIGAVEVSERINLTRVGAACLAAGCFIRPFGRIVYLTPAFIIGAAEWRGSPDSLWRCRIVAAASLAADNRRHPVRCAAR
jgi:adenosylmethionine-8-amino-7-oxononanoate aminotransferase